MSDYLRNMIAKSLGLAEVLQPRRASRFEPPPDMTGMPPLDSAYAVEAVQAEWSPARSLTELHPPPPGQGPTPSRYASQNQAEGRDDQSTASAEGGDDQSTASPAGRFPLHPAPAEVPPDSPQTTSRQSDAKPAPQSSPQLLPQPLPQPSPQPLPRPLANMPAPTPAVTAYKPESASSPVASSRLASSGDEGEQASLLEPPRTRNVKRDESASAQATSQATTQAATPAMTVAVAAHRPEPSVSDAPRNELPSSKTGEPVFGSKRQGVRPAEMKAVSPPAQLPAATQESPTIRISIGRVEVRAIMPASPAPRTAAAPQPPRLSLDEYRKQRNGGRL